MSPRNVCLTHRQGTTLRLRLNDDDDIYIWFGSEAGLSI
jgi:hypothetical protein